MGLIMTEKKCSNEPHRLDMMRLSNLFNHCVSQHMPGARVSLSDLMVCSELTTSLCFISL